MPWTLWRSYLFELWRLVVISTVTLVVVIAFAAAVKPLADGELDAVSALKFMAFATVPMLAYALPFAAGFAATMTYHRMSEDNEVIAARAGGLSHRTLLVPAVVTGLLLAVALGGLSDQIIPRFLRRMEQMVTRDAAQLIVRQIERGQPAMIDNLEIYADGVRKAENPPDGVVDLLELRGVAAVETDKEGRVVSDATSRIAYVLLLESDGESGTAATEANASNDGGSSLIGRIVLDDVVGFSDGTLIDTRRLPLPDFPVPQPFEDDPKFLTAGELRALRETPERMSFIEARRDRLARRLAAAESVAGMLLDMRENRPVTMSGPNGLSVSLRGGNLAPLESRWRIMPPAGEQRVSLDRIRLRADGQRSIERITAETAYLRIDSERSADAVIAGRDEPARLAFRIELIGVSIRPEAGMSSTIDAVQRPSDEARGLTLRNNTMLVYKPMGASALVNEARRLAIERPDYAATTKDATDDLAKRVMRLNREITSKLHERFATAASCFVMVLVGAIMALKLSSSLPLVVYLWSFFPALLTILLISAGQQHAHRESIVIGLPLLWSGIVGLAGYGAAVLADVSRN